MIEELRKQNRRLRELLARCQEIIMRNDEILAELERKRE